MTKVADGNNFFLFFYNQLWKNIKLFHETYLHCFLYVLFYMLLLFNVLIFLYFVFLFTCLLSMFCFSNATITKLCVGISCSSNPLLCGILFECRYLLGWVKGFLVYEYLLEKRCSKSIFFFVKLNLWLTVHLDLLFFSFLMVLYK